MSTTPVPIAVTLPLPGENAIVAISMVIKAGMEMNAKIWDAASQEKRAALADEILDSNRRLLEVWGRVLDFFHVPKVDTK